MWCWNDDKDNKQLYGAGASRDLEQAHKSMESKVSFTALGRPYEVDLSNLNPGTYNFTISVTDQGLARSGMFTIVPFEIEKQFLNAALLPLQKVAQNTDGTLYTVDQVQELINALVDDKRYIPVQKSTENIVPFIDWRWLLGVIALLLAIEWFLRKYNGLT